MGHQIGLYPISSGSSHWSWERMAFPVSLLQKRRRCLFNTVLHHVDFGGNPHVFHGVGFRADDDDRWTWRFQYRPYFQR